MSEREAMVALLKSIGIGEYEVQFSSGEIGETWTIEQRADAILSEYTRRT